MSSEGLFNVYIERAGSASPDAAAKLAQAMAAHYGIDAAAIEQRLAVGRFRVKGNVDRATADSFAADLVKLGAMVKVERAEEATPPPPSAPVAAGKPAKRNRTPPTGVKIPSPVSLQQPRVAAPAKPAPAPAPAPVPKPAPLPAPAPVQAPAPAPASAPPVRPSQPQFTSGLAAAAAARSSDEGGLGALSGEMPLTLSTLDGADESELSGSRNVPLPASFGPPSQQGPRVSASGQMAIAAPEEEVDVAMDDDDDDDLSLDMPAEIDPAALPASIGPAVLPASIGPAASARDLGAGPAPPSRNLGGANDMFAPPEASADEVQLALDVAPVKKKRPTAPPPVMAEAAPEGAHAAAAPPRVSAQQAVVRVPGESAWKTYGKDERVRFVAGIFVAALVGGIPALVTAAVRERSAFSEIDSQLERQQSTVLTRADWDGLDRVRASFVERKRAERQSIALTSLILWAAVSGGVAFLWFRKVDWDRIFGR